MRTRANARAINYDRARARASARSIDRTSAPHVICKVIGCTVYSIQETVYSPGLVVAAKNGERFVYVAKSCSTNNFKDNFSSTK